MDHETSTGTASGRPSRRSGRRLHGGFVVVTVAVDWIRLLSAATSRSCRPGQRLPGTLIRNGIGAAVAAADLSRCRLVLPGAVWYSAAVADLESITCLRFQARFGCQDEADWPARPGFGT